MPNPNARYPLVAIPKTFFDVLLQGVEQQRDSCYSLASVNECVQTTLNHGPMFDYLLRLVVRDNRGVESSTLLVGDPNLKVIGLKMSLQRVRVTESQFEMLSRRQAQYASDGLRIPISCIVSSMLFQWSEEIRDACFVQPGQWEEGMQVYPMAWIFGDVKGRQVMAAFHVTTEQGVETHRFSHEAKLDKPTVIVGWNPQKRSLRGENPTALGD